MPLQVTASWKWYNYLAIQAAPKQPLRLNLDETCMQFLPPTEAGAVPAGTPADMLRLQSTRAKARANFSYIGLICDNKRIQEALPQIFLVRMQHLSAAATRLLQEQLPPNYIIHRLRRAWTTTLLMLQMIRVLAVCLQPWRETHQPILLMDALGAHCTPIVLQVLQIQFLAPNPICHTFHTESSPKTPRMIH